METENLAARDPGPCEAMRAALVALSGSVDEFTRQGWDVWWDDLIEVGTKYSRVLDEALNQSRCVLVCWTELTLAYSPFPIEPTSRVFPGSLRLPFCRSRNLTRLIWMAWDASTTYHLAGGSVAGIERGPLKNA